MRSPILFVVFNRPDTTARVFAEIRKARPARLYVAADGPRPTKDSDTALCADAREIATAVDWPCDVKTRFSSSNNGCRGVAAAVDWFFQQEEEGIVLEDDTVPSSGFFEYCDELLDRYRGDHRVGMVLGSNFIAPYYQPIASYFFSGYPHIWGWASWRRTWKLYDGALSAWPDWRDGAMSRTFSIPEEVEYWRKVFDSVYAGEIDTWAYQLMFTCWRNGLLTINPRHNLVSNIGFGDSATHTFGEAPDYVVNSPSSDIALPLFHPDDVRKDPRADRLIWQYVYHRSLSRKLNRFVARIRGLMSSGRG